MSAISIDVRTCYLQFSEEGMYKNGIPCVIYSNRCEDVSFTIFTGRKLVTYGLFTEQLTRLGVTSL